jgi:hypothetical protein
VSSCKIIVKDEVNIKIEGLDLSDRKTLVNKFKYEIPGARYTPSVKLGRWDGKVAFFQLSGSTYVNLLQEILPYLESQGYDIELHDLRNYSTSFVFKQITEDVFSDKSWPEGHPKAGDPVLLRDYQLEIINNFLENPQSIQEVATGAGKTLMTAALSYSVQPYGRSIVIVPNKSLVTQTESDYVNLGLDVGVYYGDRKEVGRQHTICTWQSLNILLKNSTGRDIKSSSGSFDDNSDITVGEFLEGVVCVIVDECFDGESKVLTTTGYVAIKDIKPGDQVINYSEDTKKFKVDTVIQQHKNLTKSVGEKMYILEFDNESKISVTGNHRFLTTVGWVRADALTEEHEIINKTIIV